MLDRDLSAPPSSPADGDRYIVAAAPSGAWTGAAGAVAWFDVNAWRILQPQTGWIAWIADESLALCWSGLDWTPLASVNPVSLMGVNATADATNRLAVSSAGSLFNHAGAGHQLKINKASAADTASLLFQTGFAGRSEIGAMGDDHLRFKTQGADAIWREALIIDRNTAMAALPATPFGENLLINGDFAINQRGFAGGALAAGDYGCDRWKAGAGGATLSISGDVATLSAGSILQIVEGGRGPWRTVTLSVEDLSGGAIAMTVNGATQTVTPGAGRKGAAFDLSSLPAASHCAVALAPASGAVSFKRVKLEYGAFPSAWSPRHRADELRLCQRYHQRCAGGVPMVAPAAAQASGYGSLPVVMRATPSPVMSAAATIAMPGVGSASVTGANLSAFSMLDASIFTITFASGSPATAAGQAGFLHGATLQFSAEL